MMFTAAGENSAGDIVLPTNGAARVMARPLLHAGDAICEKSPASIRAVGTLAKAEVGVTCTFVPW